jgi:hypothetical protein
MRFLRSTALASAALLAISGVVAYASEWDKKTELTVKETIEVPGATLPPGHYVVKLVDSQSNRHIVQFLNEDEDEVLSTVIAIPNSRMEPTGDTQFEWYETPAGQPPALRAWFYPGDNFGQEFAYPEGRAAELAQSTQQEVPRMTEEDTANVTTQPEQRQETETAEAAPAPEPEQPAVIEERETVIAQAEPQPQPQARPQPEPQPAPQPQQNMAQDQNTQQDETELPETAGFGALLALIGFGSLGASAAIRKLRR